MDIPSFDMTESNGGDKATEPEAVTARIQEIEAALRKEIAQDNFPNAKVKVTKFFHLAHFLYVFQKEGCLAILDDEILKNDHRAIFLKAIICFDDVNSEEKCDAIKGMKKVAQIPSDHCDDFVWAARYNLGLLHFLGVSGVRRSDDLAEQYWLSAADNGNPSASLKAQLSLAMFYGRPESKDLVKAFRWYEIAAENGSIEAQAAIALMLDKGLGVCANKEKAFHWAKAASSNGSIYGSGLLVQMYFASAMFSKAVMLATITIEKYSAMVSGQYQTGGKQDENDRLLSSLGRSIDCTAEKMVQQSGTDARGLCLCAFYLARSLETGKGVCKDLAKAQQFYSQSYRYEPDFSAELQFQLSRAEIR